LNSQAGMDGKKVIVFGAGETARRFCEISGMKIDCFIDNDAEKQNRSFLGKPVLSPKMLQKPDIHGAAIILIANAANYQDIAAQLDGMGFNEGIDYFNCNEVFFQELSGPLYTDSQLGKYVKDVMLSSQGVRLRAKLPQYNPWCRMFPSLIAILSDGSVTTCCGDAFGQQTFGNIYERDLNEIWHTEFPRIVATGLYDLKICSGCIGNYDKTAKVSLISAESDYQKWVDYRNKYPNTLQIEIMGACNYRCCLAAEVYKHRPVKPDLERFFGRLKSFLPHIRHINLFHFGEPLLNDGFCAFIQNCRQVVPQVSMLLSTNGMLMDETVSQALIAAKINQVIISVHGGPGTENMLKYSKVNADYDLVLKNTRKLIALRNQLGSQYPKIALKTVLFDWNDTDELMDQLRSDAGKLGLKPTGGSAVEDTYYWVRDITGKWASKRFVAGSDELHRLIQNGEFC
jgi:MoaA/NifB/PqqE/SkfB family radical SAM enzyme